MRSEGVFVLAWNFLTYQVVFMNTVSNVDLFAARAESLCTLVCSASLIWIWEVGHARRTLIRSWLLSCDQQTPGHELITTIDSLCKLLSNSYCAWIRLWIDNHKLLWMLFALVFENEVLMSCIASSFAFGLRVVSPACDVIIWIVHEKGTYWTECSYLKYGRAYFGDE